MKILHVVFALETGGAETMLVDIANEQSKLEDVELLVVNNLVNAGLVRRLDNKIKVHFLSRAPGSLNPLKILQFNYLIHKIDPDIVHFHDHKGIRLLKYKPRAQSFLTVHDVRDPVDNLARYDVLVSISEAVQKDIFVRGNQKSIKVYNGIDFSQLKTRTSYLKPKVFKIVQVSRLHHQKKGQHLLLKAIHQLVYRAGMKDISVDFIGEGASLSYLNELAKELGVARFIRFLGNCDRSYIYNNLRNYDLLVQPSIYEGFGLTVVEGVGAGLPVLVSNIDGPAEIVRNLPSCWQFQAGNAEALAHSILDVKRFYSENRIEQACRESYSMVVSKFSIGQTSQRYINLYRSTSIPVLN